MNLSKYEFSYMSKAFELRESTQGFYHLSCPSCGEKVGRSGAYKPAFSRYYCMQPGCMYGKTSRSNGTSIIDLVKELETLVNFKAAVAFLKGFKASDYTRSYTKSSTGLYVPQKAVKLTLPYGYTNIKNGTSKVAKDARKYLSGRGYDLTVCANRYKLGYVDKVDPTGKNYRGYLVIPFFNRWGDFIYYQLRALYPYLQRWDNPSVEELGVGKEHILFNESVLFEREEAFIHEGATDGMTTDSPGTLGLFISDTHIDLIRTGKVKRVFFMYDEGAFYEGLNNAYKATGTGTDIYLIPIHKGEDDPNKLGREKCEAKKEEAILIDDYSYFEEMNRIEWDTIEGKGGRKSFRGESGIQVFF